jgi:hypothetical protein
MNIESTHVGPSAVAAFLASMVEFVEALTVVLAVGSVRGWHGALTGAAAAIGAARRRSGARHRSHLRPD